MSTWHNLVSRGLHCIVHMLIQQAVKLRERHGILVIKIFKRCCREKRTNNILIMIRRYTLGGCDSDDAIWLYFNSHIPAVTQARFIWIILFLSESMFPRNFYLTSYPFPIRHESQGSVAITLIKSAYHLDCSKNIQLPAILRNTIRDNKSRVFLF